MAIFIPGNVPSSKNSRVSCAKGSFHSKTVRKYLQNIGVKQFSARSGVENYKTRPNLFAEAVSSYFEAVTYPVELGFHFVRGTRHKFDIINATQIICDLLVAHGYIVDDDTDHLIPSSYTINGKWYTYDRENPGVFLKILGR